MPYARKNFSILNNEGEPVNDATVKVEREVVGLPLAVIYSDENGTLLANPYVPADGRNAGFNAAGGFYRITVSHASFGSIIWQREPVGTSQGTDFEFAFLPRGAWSGATTYAQGDLVSHTSGAGQQPYAFVSNANTNLNHAPQFTSNIGISDVWWTVVGLIETPQLVVIPAAFSGKPGNGEVVEGMLFTDPTSFPAGLGASRARSRVAATATTVIDILHNGAVVGTVTFAAASTTGTFAMGSNLAIVAGDQIDFRFPNPADLTLSGIKITLRGTR